jgi:hypothetical protein
MEKILINKNKLTYRGDDYEIASYELIGNEFVHVTTTTNMTIALVPGDTVINGVIAKKIEDIESALK